MNVLKRQAGMGSLGWLVTLVIAGFSVMCAYKLIPPYIDNTYRQAALKSLATDPEGFSSLDSRDIRSKLENFMSINNVRDVDVKKDYKIVRKQDRTLVNNFYERRIPLFANIDVVLTFRNQLDSKNLDKCCDYLVED